MMKQLLIILCAVLLLASCSDPYTTYRIDYRFDNTELQSDFLEVYEFTPQGGNGKWRTSLHHYDTIMIDGEPHEMAYGTLEEPAREDATELHVLLSGYRPGIGGYHRLDTIFTLTLGEDNTFVITPDMQWL